MIVEPCPPECTFDWRKFHSDLDTAMAHMIEEGGKNPLQPSLPSKVNLFEFAKYSYEKAKLQENK